MALASGAASVLKLDLYQLHPGIIEDHRATSEVLQRHVLEVRIHSHRRVQVDTCATAGIALKAYYERARVLQR